MGLFGGFKAKFRANSETKQKSERVVVLRYQVHSEFDSNSNDIKKPVAYRRPTTTRPTILHANGDNTNGQQSSDFAIVKIPQEHNHKNSGIIKSTDKKPLPLDYSKRIPQASEVDNTLEPCQSADSTQTPLWESPKWNHKSSSINRPLPQLSTSPQKDNEEVSVPQHSSKMEAKNNLVTTSSRATSNEDNHEDQDDFQVNVVHHSSVPESPSSEDEDQEEELSEYVSLEYSSQAASIFFGNDESPTFSRPRRVRLRDEDKTEDGEAEC